MVKSRPLWTLRKIQVELGVLDVWLKRTIALCLSVIGGISSQDSLVKTMNMQLLHVRALLGYFLQQTALRWLSGQIAGRTLRRKPSGCSGFLAANNDDDLVPRNVQRNGGKAAASPRSLSSLQLMHVSSMWRTHSTSPTVCCDLFWFLLFCLFLLRSCIYFIRGESGFNVYRINLLSFPRPVCRHVGGQMTGVEHVVS